MTMKSVLRALIDTQRTLLLAACAVLLGAVLSAPAAHAGAIASGALDGRAPVGSSASGTWWQPAPDQFSASNLWFFDPVGEAIPYGFRKAYQPTGVITPFEQQFPFTYTKSGNSLQLSSPTGSRQTVTILDYDAGQDILTVNWEGYAQQWVGCASSAMPAVAAAACR